MNQPDTLVANQVVTLFQSGRFVELEQLTSRLLEDEPRSCFFWKAHGVARQMQGKEAVASFAHACTIAPEDAEAHTNLGNALRDVGHLVEAREQFEYALTITPDAPDSLLNLGNVMQALGEYSHATSVLRHALDVHPGNAEAAFSMGLSLTEAGSTKAAINSYRRALTIKPEFAQAHNNLALLLCKTKEFQQAEQNLKTAVMICPDYADGWYNLGNLYSDTRQLELAIHCYQQAAILRPDHADTFNSLGDTWQRIGQLKDAARAYSAAIAIRPDFITAHYSLSQLKKYRQGDPHCALLEHEIAHTEAMPIASRVQFWFTLGKVYEDLQQYEASFAAYREGNQLQASQLDWNEAAEADLFVRAKKTFSSAYFKTNAVSDIADATPIFIVGLPRSGTSLIEQILASYPNVFGAGELPLVYEVVVRNMPDADYARFPEAVLQFSREQLAKIGMDYLREVKALAPQATHIVDKMPANFFYLGLIHQILPNAKIIHAMREPMDSCFSCYSRLFENQNLPYSYDLETLGRYYLRYADLMQHWHAVLPPETILDLSYEEMVADIEGQVRRMLDYLGLPWNPACLDFYQNTRQVKTASSAQVRQPIYQSSVARWQNFAQYLTPLKKLVTQISEH